MRLHVLFHFISLHLVSFHFVHGHAPLQELTKQAGGRKKSKSAPAFSAELSESTEHDDATIFASFDLNKAKTKMLK